MNDRFRISSLLAGRLAEHKIALPTLLRRAGVPAGFFQQERIYATTAELFALWRAIAEMWEGTSPGEWRTRHRTAEAEVLAN
jgi:hypothetical protein